MPLSSPIYFYKYIVIFVENYSLLINSIVQPYFKWYLLVLPLFSSIVCFCATDFLKHFKTNKNVERIYGLLMPADSRCFPSNKNLIHFQINEWENPNSATRYKCKILCKLFSRFFDKIEKLTEILYKFQTFAKLGKMRWACCSIKKNSMCICD